MNNFNITVKLNNVVSSNVVKLQVFRYLLTTYIVPIYLLPTWLSWHRVVGIVIPTGHSELPKHYKASSKRRSAFTLLLRPIRVIKYV